MPLDVLPFIIVAMIIIFVVGFFGTPIGKGILGEFYVKLVLGRTKAGKKYVIHNLMIVNDEKSSQIDHILINRLGVFVIETKNYAGYIFGSENQKEWTQTLSYGKVKNRFYNPVLQNKTHIYALNKTLNKGDIFTSIIIFPKASLKVDCTTYVGHLYNIRKFIKNPTSTKQLSLEEMHEIYELLMSIKKNPTRTANEHVRQIKEMQQNIKDNICPRCGNKLVLKQGKYGDFYGCSGYPSCTFKKSSKTS